MNKLFEAHLVKGVAFGIAYDKGELQIVLFKILIQVNFRIIKSNLKLFIDCLKEN